MPTWSPPPSFWCPSPTWRRWTLVDVYDTLRSPLPWACAGLVARAFAAYRRRGGLKHRPLPDFYIGAHAAVANLSVLTRVASAYQSCFPRLRLVTP